MRPIFTAEAEAENLSSSAAGIKCLLHPAAGHSNAGTALDINIATSLNSRGSLKVGPWRRGRDAENPSFDCGNLAIGGREDGTKEV
jgi:hypothetical protein